jgi:hypothetical protein
VRLESSLTPLPRLRPSHDVRKISSAGGPSWICLRGISYAPYELSPHSRAKGSYIDPTARCLETPGRRTLHMCVLYIYIYTAPGYLAYASILGGFGTIRSRCVDTRLRQSNPAKGRE